MERKPADLVFQRTDRILQLSLRPGTDLRLEGKEGRPSQLGTKKGELFITIAPEDPNKRGYDWNQRVVFTANEIELMQLINAMTFCENLTIDRDSKSLHYFAYSPTENELKLRRNQNDLYSEESFLLNETEKNLMITMLEVAIPRILGWS